MGVAKIHWTQGLAISKDILNMQMIDIFIPSSVYRWSRNKHSVRHAEHKANSILKNIMFLHRWEDFS